MTDATTVPGHLNPANQHDSTPERPALFRVAVLTMLAIITVASIGILFVQMDSKAQSKETQCIYATYVYDADEAESSKVTFSEMDAEGRALADALDCEVEGR